MFLARVQLPENSNYDQLHKAMEGIDFFRVIQDGNNRSRELPQGTYWHTGIIDMNPSEVFDNVEKVSKSVNKKAMIVLVEAIDNNFMFSDTLPYVR